MSAPRTTPENPFRVGQRVRSIDRCYMHDRRAEVIEVIGSREVKIRFFDTDESKRWAPGEGVWPVEYLSHE